MRVSVLVVSAVLLLLRPASVHAQSDSAQPVVTHPDRITWRSASPLLEPGAEATRLAGDASASGPFTIRVRVPAGHRVAPHWHPVVEHLTVLSGTLCFSAWRPPAVAADTVCAGPGTYRVLPARTVHVEWAKTAVEYQIHGTGPFDLNYVDPADDPRRRAGGLRRE